MKYVIMCGGEYQDFKSHKALTTVNGEALVERTIRLLKQNGIQDITVTVNKDNMEFEFLDAEILHRDNSYVIKDGRVQGWWLDAFHNFNEPTCYLFGDVYYTESGIKQIIETDKDGNILFGTINRKLKNWEEPLAYKVKDIPSFFWGITETKRLHELGQTNRHPIVWELYRVLNGLAVNMHVLKPETYVNVDNGGMDIDYPSEGGKLKEFQDE